MLRVFLAPNRVHASVDAAMIRLVFEPTELNDCTRGSSLTDKVTAGTPVHG